MRSLRNPLGNREIICIKNSEGKEVRDRGKILKTTDFFTKQYITHDPKNQNKLRKYLKSIRMKSFTGLLIELWQLRVCN